MKLNSTQVERTLDQMEAQVLPDGHPAVRELTDLFGEHTFFLDSSGLLVLESPGRDGQEPHSGNVVNLADWSDATLTSLRPHEPALTGTTINFEAA